mmetsp:Transcript_511/g.1428  ORF Transcript_511/g.1428 Transcript_511/m.1428 type:complete len:745 (-) Transcript_511:27-2261(-)
MGFLARSIVVAALLAAACAMGARAWENRAVELAQLRAASGDVSPGLVWPMSGTPTPDFPQQLPFGPRNVSDTYYFNTGIDFTSPVGTPVFAAMDGVVVLSGLYPDSQFSTRVVVIEQRVCPYGPSDPTGGGGEDGEDGEGGGVDGVCFEHDPDSRLLYAVYTPMLDEHVSEGQQVVAGQRLGHTGRMPGTARRHLHFELRYGSNDVRDVINPYQLLPYADTTRHSARVSTFACVATVCNVSMMATVPRNELDVIEFSAGFFTSSGADVGTREVVNFESLNLNARVNAITLDDAWQGNVLMCPYQFSWTNRPWYKTMNYTMHFKGVARPPSAVGIAVRVVDVRGNSVEKRVPVPAGVSNTGTFTGTPSACPPRKIFTTTAPTGVQVEIVDPISVYPPDGLSLMPRATASQFFWPLSKSSTPDMPQRVPFGPASLPVTGKYVFSTGVDIATPAGTAVYAAFDGTVRLAGMYPGVYAERIVQIRRQVFPWGPNGDFKWLYANYLPMRSEAVIEGQSVTKGQLLGRSAGNATSAFLHFELRYGGALARNAVNVWQLMPYVNTRRHTARLSLFTCFASYCNIVMAAAVKRTELDLGAVDVGYQDAQGNLIGERRVFNLTDVNYNLTEAELKTTRVNALGVLVVTSRLDLPDAGGQDMARYHFTFELVPRPARAKSIVVRTIDVHGAAATDNMTLPAGTVTGGRDYDQVFNLKDKFRSVFNDGGTLAAIGVHTIVAVACAITAAATAVAA